MEQQEVIEVIREALLITLAISAPIMASGLIVGIIIAVFQAMTSIQEMTLTFVPKIIIIFLAIVIFLPFMSSTLLEYVTVQIFDRMIAIGAG